MSENEIQYRDWGTGDYTNSSGGLLIDVVRPLPPNVKQAMFAAAEHRLISRGTWDGCAFNAAGGVIAEKLASMDSRMYVHSTSDAATVFGISPNLVQRFITVWDGLPGTDDECTQQLKDALEEVGLFSDPNERRGKRIIRTMLYKSEQTRLREEFDKLVEDIKVPNMAEAAELLSLAR